MIVAKYSNTAKISPIGYMRQPVYGIIMTKDNLFHPSEVKLKLYCFFATYIVFLRCLTIQFDAQIFRGKYDCLYIHKKDFLRFVSLEVIE
jgi:hypothetical protein